MEGKINPESAEQDIKDWLDKKKILEATRNFYKDHIDVLVGAIEQGVLVRDAVANTLRQNLAFPLGAEDNDKKIDFLNYKARINDKQLQPYLKGVGNEDGNARMLAHVAALTDTARGILSSLDSTDKRIAMAIVVFFAS